MKISLCTLGCKVNHYESQILRRLFLDRGDEFVDFGTPCDVSIIHSCAVTEESSRKSRQMMRRARRISPNGVVCVLGCLAQVEPDSLPEADIVLGNTDKTKLPSLVDKFLAEKTALRQTPPILSHRAFEAMTLVSDERVRATVKIQDGCCNFCSYCIIPYARGPIRSKEIDAAVCEVENLVKNGYREIVLTGIHLDSYGKEHGRFSLCDLLERLDQIPHLERIRLGSTEPVMVTPETVGRLKDLKHFCPHFNLSLQSGCTATLKRMRRRYTAEEYAAGVELLKEAFPDLSLTTDIIVGFPGETEEEFAETLAFAEKIGFSKINVFPFSPRRGTAAWDMPDPVDPAVKKERCRRLLDLSSRLEKQYRERYVGRTLPILFEQAKNDRYVGSAPNFLSVAVKSNICLTGQILPVQITEAGETVCRGDLQNS
ncbi:MAG: tRNA (N(6)-L-threonylcarbamoyladenosine(37)-C(2))-methylthiotransferase MtaB [Clostridia bacterium]|nr:tRNA (N(6)-L-threonylcarbamoyladenosine(37)-C(2))-methylthiotransferase MtaB [Clostridia bacterium]MBQ1965359.1 tRNA (N(6)-L-threonylcarbamoyladenosine(37)-C(2))-methylthiotransferase MtaB [Clostridia bacterium]